MKRHLPDVNVLLALVWPRHESHSAAHNWFAKTGQHAWATNVLTQLGALRLLTNPVVTQASMKAAGAPDLLSKATRHAGHEYWPLDREIVPGLEPMARRLTGHGQWTDALLLSHALERGGVLVTFDSGLKELAAGELREHFLLLKGP